MKVKCPHNGCVFFINDEPYSDFRCPECLELISPHRRHPTYQVIEE